MGHVPGGKDPGFEMGTSPGETLQDRLDEIQAMIEKVRETEHPSLRAEVVVQLENEPFTAAGHEALLAAYSAATETVTCRPAKSVGFNSWLIPPSRRQPASPRSSAAPRAEIRTRSTSGSTYPRSRSSSKFSRTPPIATAPASVPLIADSLDFLQSHSHVRPARGGGGTLPRVPPPLARSSHGSCQELPQRRADELDVPLGDAVSALHGACQGGKVSGMSTATNISTSVSVTPARWPGTPRQPPLRRSPVAPTAASRRSCRRRTRSR